MKVPFPKWLHEYLRDFRKSKEFMMDLKSLDSGERESITITHERVEYEIKRL